MKTLTLFSAMVGVGKTTLVQHVAWMCAEQGIRVLVADLDPQLSLTARFLDEDQIATRLDPGGPVTITQALAPVLDGSGSPVEPAVIEVADRLALLPGDPALSLLGDDLSLNWLSPPGLQACRASMAIAELLRGAGRRWGADLVLVDLGPSFGALNRAAAIAIDYLIIPVAPGSLVLRGIENLGRKLRDWRHEWQHKAKQLALYDPDIPEEFMTPAGYVVTRAAILHGRDATSARSWLEQLPVTYRSALGRDDPLPLTGAADPCCLAVLKDYRTLAAYAAEARKPMFHLTPADGAIGSHQAAVRQCYAEFVELVHRISLATGVQPSGR